MKLLIFLSRVCDLPASRTGCVGGQESAIEHTEGWEDLNVIDLEGCLDDLAISLSGVVGKVLRSGAFNSWSSWDCPLARRNQNSKWMNGRICDKV
jgi:hypothetical protein